MRNRLVQRMVMTKERDRGMLKSPKNPREVNRTSEESAEREMWE